MGEVVRWMEMMSNGEFVLLAALSLAAAVIFPFLPEQRTGLRSLVKTLAVGCLALWAVLLGFGWLALALGASAIGDLALSRPGERAFLAGMLAFGLAHLVYTGVFVATGGLPRWDPVLLGLAFVLVLVGVWLGCLYASQAGSLAWPVRGYVGLIVAMAVTTVFVPSGPGAKLIHAGALTFVLSDAILGQREFLRRTWPGQEVVIWAAYYLAQVLLFAGIVARG